MNHQHHIIILFGGQVYSYSLDPSANSEDQLIALPT